MRFYALRLHEAGMIKSSPNADHRRGHRLALPQRAQARAEGVSRGAGRSAPEDRKEASDADHTKSPRFPGQPVRSRAARRAWRPGIARRGGAAGSRPRSGSASRPSICIAPHGTSPRTLLRMRRLHHGDLLRGRLTPILVRTAAVRRSIREIDLPGSCRRPSPRCRRADHGAGGRASGCYELFAHEPIRTYQRPQGQEGRRRGAARLEHLYVSIMAAHVGLDPRRTSTGSRRMTSPARWSCSSRARSMLSWLSCRDSRAARPQDRPRDRRHGDGPALVAVLLLHRWSDTRTSSGSIRSRPNARCAPSEGHRSVRDGAGARRAAAGRGRLRAALRLRAPDAH